MRRLAIALLATLSAPISATALVGGAPEIPDARNQPEVMLVGSGGNFCTGTAIARDLVLTAAHCIAPGDHYKLVEMGADRQPVFTDVAQVARHPQFNLKTMLAHRATADVALLKLAAPLARRPMLLLPSRARVVPGEKFVVHGYGVTIRGEGNSAGRLREATLTATGQPGNLQLRLVDSKTGGTPRGPRRLHRRLRLAGLSGDAVRPRHLRRDELVDRRQQRRRLRRPDWRHAAGAVLAVD